MNISINFKSGSVKNTQRNSTNLLAYSSKSTTVIPCFMQFSIMRVSITQLFNIV